MCAYEGTNLQDKVFDISRLKPIPIDTVDYFKVASNKVENGEQETEQMEPEKNTQLYVIAVLESECQVACYVLNEDVCYYECLVIDRVIVHNQQC